MNYSAANFTFPWVAISFRRILGTGSCNYSLAWTRLAKQALARCVIENFAVKPHVSWRHVGLPLDVAY